MCPSLSRNGNWGDPGHDTSNAAAVAAAVWSDEAKAANWGPDQPSPSWNNKPKMNPGGHPASWLNADMDGLPQQYKVGQDILCMLYYIDLRMYYITACLSSLLNIILLEVPRELVL